MAVQPAVANHGMHNRSCAPLKSAALPNRTAGHFELLSKDVGVPLVCFRLKKVIGSDGGCPPARTVGLLLHCMLCLLC